MSRIQRTSETLCECGSKTWNMFVWECVYACIYDFEIYFVVCICRWCGWQTGSENKLQHSTGWAVWPRPGQLGMCVLRRYSVFCLRTRRDRRQRGNAVLSVMGRPVFLHTVSLGEVQHWDFVPALGLRHQWSGNSLPKDKHIKRMFL